MAEQKGSTVTQATDTWRKRSDAIQAHDAALARVKELTAQTEAYRESLRSTEARLVAARADLAAAADAEQEAADAWLTHERGMHEARIAASRGALAASAAR